MNSMKSIVMTLLLAASSSVIEGKSVEADVLFKVWVDKKSPAYQAVLPDYDFKALAAELEKKDQVLIRTFIDKWGLKLGVFHNLFTSMTDDQLIEFFKNFLTLFESDAEAYVAFFTKHNLIGSDFSQREERMNFLSVIKYYNLVLSAALQPFKKKYDIDVLRVAAGNRLLDILIATKNQKILKAALKEEDKFPVIRSMLSIIWKNLSGEGWKWWHASALKRLKLASKQGQTIVYIAGGCDIHHLIEAGIYSITVIDPMLPTQPKYYVDDWLWFVKGKGDRMGMGDIINFPKQKIRMRRTYLQQIPEYFTVMLADDTKKRFQKSITVWTVEPINGGKSLGKVTFERRLCNQDDFVYAPTKRVLMSFNELYYIFTASEEDSWGIAIDDFDTKFVIDIKQARRAFTKQQIKALHRVDKSRAAFIKLGTCIN